MIVKMKFVNISGPRTDIDRVIGSYLSQYEIQLEHAITELKTTENLLPFLDVNPYKEPLAKVTQFVEFLSDSFIVPDHALSVETAQELINHCNQNYLQLTEQQEELTRTRDELNEHLKILSPFQGLDFDLSQVQKYRYIKSRFGRIPLDFYKKLEKYLYDNLGALFIEGGRDANYVYGTYFTANAESFQIDSALKALHFESVELPDGSYGTPQEIISKWEAKIAALEEQAQALEQQISDLFQSHGAQLVGAKKLLESLSANFDVRKMGAQLEQNGEARYVLCGWMSAADTTSLKEDLKGDDKVTLIIEEGRQQHFGEPPTKLKNPKLFRPFELFIHMYGMPNHNEMDPTIFVALTYTLIFGVMFGDVGQGLCLVVIGSLIYFIKKINLAGIIAAAGIFSTFFGFMFGSVFGFEDIIEPRWISPISHMTTLPFIGKLNTIFIVAVGFGIVMVLLSMVIHIINSIRSHDIGRTWFDANGVAGLIFYGSAAAVMVLFLSGKHLPGTILLAFMFGLPLLLIALKEPIIRKIKHRANKMEESKGMFLVQTFFELFETLLSYFSNTLSFVRIGAFAVSHAAMMQVVLMLSGNETGHTNWIVVILGNLLVCALEGLVVGIQVLRLEYYELFSRFYSGSGREFTPYQDNKQRK